MKPMASYSSLENGSRRQQQFDLDAIPDNLVNEADPQQHDFKSNTIQSSEQQQQSIRFGRGQMPIQPIYRTNQNSPHGGAHNNPFEQKSQLKQFSDQQQQVLSCQGEVSSQKHQHQNEGSSSVQGSNPLQESIRDLEKYTYEYKNQNRAPDRLYRQRQAGFSSFGGSNNNLPSGSRGKSQEDLHCEAVVRDEQSQKQLEVNFPLQRREGEQPKVNFYPAKAVDFEDHNYELAMQQQREYQHQHQYQHQISQQNCAKSAMQESRKSNYFIDGGQGQNDEMRASTGPYHQKQPHASQGSATELRSTQPETAAIAAQESKALWTAGGVNPPHQQTSFVRDLKRELNMRSQTRLQPHPYADDSTVEQQLQQQPRQEGMDLSDGRRPRERKKEMSGLHFKTFDDHQKAIERSRSRSKSPLPIYSQSIQQERQTPMKFMTEVETDAAPRRSRSPISRQRAGATSSLVDLQNQKNLNDAMQSRQSFLPSHDDDLHQSYRNMPRQHQHQQQQSHQDAPRQQRMSVSPAALRATHLLERQSLENSLAESLELQGYYKQMAEEYRGKYLTLEREFQYLKHTHEYDMEKMQQEHLKIEEQLGERITFEKEESNRKITFEKEESNRRVEKVISERDSQVDHLIEDNKMMQNRLLEEDQLQAQLRQQIQQVTRESHAYLDQIAEVKREKEYEVTRLLSDFRTEKEAILEKAQKERHSRDDKIKSLEMKAERDQESVRSKNTLKRLEAERKHEEVKERLEKENDKLKLSVAQLTEKTTKEGDELQNVLQEKQRMHKELQKLVSTTSDDRKELKSLRQARNELTSEREELIGDLQGHSAEIENVYQINRELKAKIKRLEGVLYGRNMSGKSR